MDIKKDMEAVTNYKAEYKDDPKKDMECKTPQWQVEKIKDRLIMTNHRLNRMEKANFDLMEENKRLRRDLDLVERNRRKFAGSAYSGGIG